jgi:hypothetical protein
MSTSKQDDDKERREVLENDRHVHEQERAATMHGHAIASADDEAGGRFARVNPTMVVGSTPGPSYPVLPASSPWHGPDPVGLEPPLGYRIDDLEHGGVASAPEAQAGPASDAPSPLKVEGDVPRGVGPLSPTGEHDDAA